MGGMNDTQELITAKQELITVSLYWGQLSAKIMKNDCFNSRDIGVSLRLFCGEPIKINKGMLKTSSLASNFDI